MTILRGKITYELEGHSKQQLIVQVAAGFSPALTDTVSSPIEKTPLFAHTHSYKYFKWPSDAAG